MDDSFRQCIEEFLDNGTLPPKVTDRLLLASVYALAEEVAAVKVQSQENAELMQAWRNRAIGIAAGLSLLGGALGGSVGAVLLKIL